MRYNTRNYGILDKQELLNKILSKVVPHLNGCWIWCGACSDRYGQITYKHKKWLVHRLIFKIYYPKIYKEDLNICHKCDNTFCVNPEHLFIGTQFDNIQDCINKGRHNQNGILNVMSTLTEEQVKEIRKNGYNKAGWKIARKYNISIGTVSNIINKVTYKDIP